MTRSTVRTTLRPVAALVVGGLAPILLGSCTSDSSQRAEGPRTSRQCFAPLVATSFRSNDDRIIHIRANASDVFQLEAVPPCRGLNWGMQMSLRPRFGTTLCVGDRASIVTRVGGRARQCTVWVRAMLTPEQVAALSPRDRP